MLDNNNLLLGDGSESPNYLNIETQTVAPVSLYSRSTLLTSELLPSIPENELNSILTYLTDDVSFPLPDYPADIGDKTEYFNFANYKTPISYFLKKDINGNYTSQQFWYGGSHECDGFAKYAHDCYYHMVDWSKTSYTWSAGDKTGLIIVGYDENDDAIMGYKQIRTAEHVREFFQDLTKGAFIRYGKDDDESPENGCHSIIFDHIDGAGVWVYECNQDKTNCGVFFQYYSFEKIASHYGWINYWVNHHISIVKTNYSATYHKLSCTSTGCNAFILQVHRFSTDTNPVCMDCGAIKYVEFG